MKSKRGLSVRVTYSFGIVLTLFLSLLALILGTLMFRASGRDAEQYAQAAAERYASDTRRNLETPMRTAQSISLMLSNTEDFPEAQRREIIDSIISKAAIGNKDFAAVWTIWEHNGIDGADDRFAGNPLFPPSGRFASFWYLDASSSLQRWTMDDPVPSDDYYNLPLSKGKPMMFGPWNRRNSPVNQTVLTYRFPSTTTVALRSGPSV